MKHIRKRTLSILLTLVLLLSLVPGMSLTAYAAPTESLLTTITPTGKTTHSATVDGVVTVSHNNDFYDGTYGWLWYDAVDTLTVSACEGYTITKCIFKQNAKNPVTDSSAPFELHFDSMGQWGGVECRENYQFDGVTSIEVYGYVSTVAVTGVELNKTSTTLTVGGTETLTATVSPDDATDKSVTWASDNTAVATVADGVVTAVAPGTANITVTTTDGSKTATCAVTVTKPTAAATASGFTGAYDGNPHGITVTVTKPESGYTVKYGTTEGTYSLDASPTITNVSESPLTVYYQVTADGYDAATGSATVTISPAEQSAPAAPTAESVSVSSVTLATIPNGEYKCGDGEWQTSPTFTGLIMNTEYTFYQRLKGDEDHNASPASPAAVIKTSNHVHSFTYSASGNTITATCTAGCTLPEGKISFSVLVPSGVTYDGNPHFASIEGGEAFSAATGIPVSADDIVYRYMVTDSVVSEPVDAGYYQVLYTLQSDFPRPVVGTGMTIAKAAGSVSYAEASVSKTFGEDAFTNPLTNTGDGSVSYASDATGVATVDASTGEVTIVGAGSTTITATVEDSTNYTYATKTASYTLTVSAVSMTVSASGYTGAYDGNSHGITVSVTAPTSGYTVKYGTTEGTYDLDASPAITNAADSPLTVYYQVTANGYNPATGSATVAISKADITPTVSLEGWTYGETAKTPSVSGNTDNGTVTYTYAAKGSTDFSATVPTNAGDYTVKATVAETDNYNGGEATADFTIAKAAITITADDKSSKYGDDLVALTYTVGGAYKTGDDLGVTVSTTATKTSDVGEYPITVSWIENANYTATLVNGKYTITKTGLTVTATGYTGAYDGAAHGITVDVGSSGATVYYAAEALTAENYTTAGSTTNPTYTDAGEYTVYFYVVSGNYDPDTVSGSKTVSISKATGTATDAQKPTAKTDLVADNTDQALVTAPASLPEGYTAIQYSLDGETWTDTIPTGKDAGDYTVNYKYVGDSNHNDFQGEPITVTIKTLTVTFEVNGGSAVAAQNVIKGEKATKPADPEKAGNAFDGWFQDATFSVAFDFDTPITADTTLYAMWTPNDYTLQSITGTTTDVSHSWTKGSGKDVVITVKLTTEPDNSFSHFTGVQIDGKTLTRDTDYTAREGSTIVTLKPATLQKLSVGVHTVTINFDNGSVETKLTIKAAPGSSTSPKTGDTSLTGLWAALMAVSGIGLGGMLLVDHKCRKARTR